MDVEDFDNASEYSDGDDESVVDAFLQERIEEGPTTAAKLLQWADCKRGNAAKDLVGLL